MASICLGLNELTRCGWGTLLGSGNGLLPHGVTRCVTSYDNCHGIPNHWKFPCLFKSLLRLKTKRIKTLYYWRFVRGIYGIIHGDSSQRVSNAENILMPWCHQWSAEYSIKMLYFAPGLGQVPVQQLEIWASSSTWLYTRLQVRLLVDGYECPRLEVHFLSTASRSTQY